MGTYDTIGGTPRHDPEFEDSFAECYALLKMHGLDTTIHEPETYEECEGCPVQQCCLSYHQNMKLPLDVQTLFKDVMSQLNLKYKQHLPQKGHSWMQMSPLDEDVDKSLRVLFFKQYHAFVDAINTPVMSEADRFAKLVDALLTGMMLAQQWILELWEPTGGDEKEGGRL